ncbi:hypothetical protein BJY01DRAFT_255100 [Aspergillus pseudoustus]|uniref:Uncharacterized protein n=1 Tax=Aspergillus pseudoustus TaxID=1810923 RepID=A0ABR4IPE4_9EURO
MKHYSSLHADAHEHVIPINILIDRGKVFLEMEVYFKYLNRVKGVLAADVDPGDIIKISTCTLYHLDEESKMSRIQCYVGKGEYLGKVDLDKRIQESRGRASEDIRGYRQYDNGKA